MLETLEELGVAALRPLAAPETLRAELPLEAGAAAVVARARRAVRDALHGRDARRLVVVVGPCSIHDPDAALEYAERLRPLAAQHAGELVVLMRTYVEKPRTALGWKGYLNDPDLSGVPDPGEGLRRARALLRDILVRGVPCAAEVLDPTIPAYLGDCLGWAAIGARTCESQIHRELASGLPLPVGFKNGTDGSLDGALHGIAAAARPHGSFGIAPDGRACVRQTSGNPDCHLVLRGGRNGPNHAPAHVARAAAAAGPRLARPVMVDCSHDNAGRDHRRQADVCRSVCAQLRAGAPALLGVMLESHLEAGRQPFAPGVPLRRGVSITDACIGFKETEALLDELAAAVRERGDHAAR